MTAKEVNFDGLIGPTHNYAGLSLGNVASAKNAMLISNPKEAALQGLRKMKHLSDLGLTQGVLPPHARPHLPTLRGLGFKGSDKKVLEKAAKTSPELLRNILAASAMWTANAATVAPSADTGDGRVHFTIANLAAMFHRSIEHKTTTAVFKSIFADENRFAHHAALEGGVHKGDEGAANHNRFCNDYGDPGFHLFVYGRKAFDKKSSQKKFPRRQTLEASQAIARFHHLDQARVHFVQQNPGAIDAGAFHNDVVAVSNKNVFFYHEEAFVDPATLQKDLQKKAGDLDLHFIEVPKEMVSLEDVVGSYLFNSQLVSVPGVEQMTLILPMEAKENPKTKTYLEGLVAGNQPIGNTEFLDVRQSMRNGGGPACLRLRVVLTDEEQKALGANVILNDKLYADLCAWVKAHYRDQLSVDDLSDPALMDESFAALDALTKLLKLGSVYEFQKG